MIAETAPLPLHANSEPLMEPGASGLRRSFGVLTWVDYALDLSRV